MDDRSATLIRKAKGLQSYILFILFYQQRILGPSLHGRVRLRTWRLIVSIDPGG